MGRALHMELREHKSSFIVYFVLRALVILMMILQIFNRNYENVFLCLLTLVLLVMPSLIQINLKIELPTALEITILVFIFAAEILGEIQAYYIILGYCAAHAERISDGGHRICTGGYLKQERALFHPAVPGVLSYRCILFFYDHRRDLGVL